jgi:hypothetical protein
VGASGGISVVWILRFSKELSFRSNTLLLLLNLRQYTRKKMEFSSCLWVSGGFERWIHSMAL